MRYLFDDDIDSSVSKYINVFNTNKIALMGTISFPEGMTESCYLILYAYDASEGIGGYGFKYKTIAFKPSEANSDGSLSFCEVVDVEPMNALEVKMITNYTTAGVYATVGYEAKEVML